MGVIKKTATVYDADSTKFTKAVIAIVDAMQEDNLAVETHYAMQVHNGTVVQSALIYGREKGMI